MWHAMRHLIISQLDQISDTSDQVESNKSNPGPNQRQFLN
jgi:hypothetical protein